MGISRFARHFGTLAAVALFAGCGTGSGSPVGAPLNNSAALGGATMMARPDDSQSWMARLDHSRSWMDPEAKKHDLLYVSDSFPYGSNDVYVYSYPKGKLKGQLTGFNEPSGQCVDKAGDVFIANFGASQILEYAHGGTIPINTLADPGYYPLGCSVDPTTGNLAVTNRLSTSFTNGDVAIYPHASGTPTSYTDPNFYYYEFCGYDNHGNLYIDGTTKGSALVYAELPSGSSSLSELNLDQSIGFPGGVQWDGKHLAIGDQSAAVIYQFAISGSTGTKVGSTPLTGSKDVVQFWIQGKRVIGPDAGLADVGLYKYPSGGSPTKTIVDLGEPVGATVSRAK
jgi:DNA-binding beta-propeller fold protein YncE